MHELLELGADEIQIEAARAQAAELKPDASDTFTDNDLWDKNRDAVRVYRNCRWTITIVTGLADGKRIHEGIAATEIKAACDLLDLPAPTRQDVLWSVRIMERTALPILNPASADIVPAGARQDAGRWGKNVPFYIRKAISLGLLRFNISKSGVGVSVGVKGLRLGTGPRGNYVHMGRHGLYYRKMLNGRPGFAQARRSEPSPVHEHVYDSDVEVIESGSVLTMEHANASEVLADLRRAASSVRIAPFIAIPMLFCCLLVWANSLPGWMALVALAMGAAVALPLHLRDIQRKTVVLAYDLEPEVEREYAAFHDAFEQLMACGAVWAIETRRHVQDTKYSAGANQVVGRQPARPRKGNPPVIRANIDIPLMPAGRQLLAFLPDFILVIDGADVGAVGYCELDYAASDRQFVESEHVPADATVIGSTWQYVNRNGGPDRRFKNNREIPIARYAEISLTSRSGLHEVFMVSDPSVTPKLAAGLTAMRRISTKEV